MEPPDSFALHADLVSAFFHPPRVVSCAFESSIDGEVTIVSHVELWPWRTIVRGSVAHARSVADNTTSDWVHQAGSWLQQWSLVDDVGTEYQMAGGWPRRRRVLPGHGSSLQHGRSTGGEDAHDHSAGRPPHRTDARASSRELTSHRATSRSGSSSERVPRLSEFYGIVISMYFQVHMYFQDHNPPHFHAIYAEHEALVRIDSGEIIRGRLPKTAGTLVEQWRRLHVEALMANWERAQEPAALTSVEPLQ